MIRRIAFYALLVLAACTQSIPQPVEPAPPTPAPAQVCTPPAVWIATYDVNGKPTGGYCFAYPAGSVPLTHPGT